MIDMTLAELLTGLDLSNDSPAQSPTLDDVPSSTYVNRMAKITIYRVEFYDVRNDASQRSNRWWTRQGAETFKAHILEDTALEVDDSCLEAGEQWTARGYDPHATKGVQTQVR